MKDNLEKSILGHLIHGSEREFAKVFTVLSVEDFTTYKKYAEVMFKAWKNGENHRQELTNANLKISTILSDEILLSLDKTVYKLKRMVMADRVKVILDTASHTVSHERLTETVSDVQQKLIHAVSETSPDESNIENIIEEFRAYQTEYEEKRKNGIELLGESTGYKKLDEIIDGLRPGHLWIIGGYTNLGKTYGSLNIAAELIRQKKRTVFFSLEMTRVDILARTVGILTDQNGNTIAKGFDDKAKTDKAMKMVEDSRFGVYTSKNDISQIIMAMHAEVIKDKPALFIVDFLQLVHVKDAQSEYETTTTAILEIQNAAQRFGVPIIVLSQVSNESAKQGDQQFMGFKGSGAIAAAADLAIELVSGEENVKDLRQKMNDGKSVFIKWHIKKNRHGRVGSIMMNFMGKTGVFSEHDETVF